ncbi:MAG: type III-B CRISPR module-associated Cmr3 family protein [Dermatophilaceae bacterium]|nr:hypothetical protein [Actinomycetales bacterium]
MTSARAAKAVMLKLAEPAQLATLATSDQLNRTETYVPGWVVRGALANAWLTQHAVRTRTGRFDLEPDQRKQFVSLFEGNVRFSPLYAGGQLPVPLSVFGHKHEDADLSHRFDAAHEDDFTHPEVCPVDQCRQRIEGKRGLAATPSVVTRSSVVVGQDGTAVKGLLFSRASLDPRGGDTTFTGVIEGPSDLLGVLTSLSHVRIGGRRTAQGGAAVNFEELTQTPEPDVLKNGTLLLRLVAPAIFVDDQGRSLPHPSEAELSRVLGQQATVAKAWSRWERIGGWHVASGLPKHTELAVCAGSTFAISPGGHGSFDRDKVISLLGRGLGLRRHEGFGHLRQSPFAVKTQLSEGNSMLKETTL